MLIIDYNDVWLSSGIWQKWAVKYVLHWYQVLSPRYWVLFVNIKYNKLDI